jgi:copper resistance protein C
LSPVAKRALLAAGLLALAARAPAEAHAIVVHSTPAAGAKLAASPEAVTVRFNGRIDRGRSLLSLAEPDKTVRPLAIADEGAETELRARLQPLPPGAYRLHWQVLSADGHITRGIIPFSVGTP